MPQWRVQRARHQGAKWLRRRAISHRAAIRHQARSATRNSRRLVGARQHLAKAWEHTEYVGGRSKAWRPRTVLVTGAGPIGLLAALFGAQRGLDVHVLDRDSGGEKESLVRELGGTYHAGGVD
ncbi:MAG TPA: FAD-dependent monooxygenase, partial [Xanthobacteraceae bacterium]